MGTPEFDISTPMTANPANFNGGPPASELKSRGYFMGFSDSTDKVYIGKHCGSVVIDITQDRVDEYKKRTEDENDYTKIPGFSQPVAPATLFPSHTSYETSSWYVPNVHGNLHAVHSWQFYAPMMVGDKVLASRTVVDRYVKRDRLYIAVEANFTKQSTGQLLAKLTQHQSFVTDQSEAAVKSWQDGTSAKSQGQSIPKERPAITHPDKTGEVLEIFGPVKRQANPDLCERYQGITAEQVRAGKGFSNGHLDPGESAGMGFPGVVVVGTLSVCFLNELMTKRFGKGYFEGGSLDVKFTRPLWLGSTVEAYGVIRKWDQDGPRRRRATCEVWTHTEDGTVTILGTATAFEDIPGAKL